MRHNFSEKEVERVLKLRRVADTEGGATENERAMAARQMEKMEQKSAGLLKFVQEKVDQLAQKDKEREFVRATTGYEPPPDPPEDAGWFTRAFYSAYRYGVRKVMDDLDEDELSQAIHEKKREYKKRVHKTGLKQRLYEEVGVGEVVLQGDDDGLFLHLDLDIPIELWDKIVEAKTGGARLVEWLDELAGDEGEPKNA
jgi:hypothetical protein